MPSWITICDTCKTPETAATSSAPVDGISDGARLAAMIEAAAQDVPEVRTRRVSCLMGCTHGCNIAIQAQGKLAYTLGRFVPDAEAAAGIVAYAAAHAASETGQVPFRTWPQAIKGHFVTRHPPLPADDA